MADVQVTQASVKAVADFGASESVHLNGAIIKAVYNIPSEEVLVNNLKTTAVTVPEVKVRVSQAMVKVVIAGRVDNPRLRAWTFTLDGHDFYVLRLGDDSTLVYDFYSKKWTDWSSGTLPFWRSNVGINWLGAGLFANNFGSNVIVGDDTFGLLWILDPNLALDQHPAGDTYNDIPFPRIVMGQVTQLGRNVQPCDVVYLASDVGAPGYVGAAVTLEISDDRGVTFQSQGAIEIVADDYSQEIAWRSLGQISAPGRLFKITDDGAITRIDGLEMNNDAG